MESTRGVNYDQRGREQTAVEIVSDPHKAPAPRVPIPTKIVSLQLLSLPLLFEILVFNIRAVFSYTCTNS